MKKLIAFSVIIFWIIGCATIPTANLSAAQQYKTRTYAVALTPCFAATLQALENANFPIQDIDKDNGLIITGNRSVTMYSFQQKASVHVTAIDATSTQVKINLMLDGKEVFNQHDYRILFDAIQKALA